MRKYFSELDILITEQRTWIGVLGKRKIPSPLLFMYNKNYLIGTEGYHSYTDMGTASSVFRNSERREQRPKKKAYSKEFKKLHCLTTRSDKALLHLK